MATYNSFKRIATDSFINSSIATGDMANNAVAAGKFQSAAITAGKFENASVGATQLASTIDLSTKTVTYRSIVDGDVATGAAIEGSKLASGAIVANLGYTPLNNAGGTMTGALRVPDGSASSPSITQSGNTNTGIYFDGSNVRFAAAGAEQMSIDGSGRMIRGTSESAGTVAFRSDGTSGWNYNNSYGGTSWRHLNSAFGWTTGNQRGGSNFNSDGVFTAPVSGFYHFMFQTYGHNDGNGTGSYIHLSFGRNGGVAFARGQTPHGIFAHGTCETYPHGIIMDLSTYMDASENMRIFVYWAGNSMRFHGAHSIFNGYLVT